MSSILLCFFFFFFSLLPPPFPLLCLPAYPRCLSSLPFSISPRGLSRAMPLKTCSGFFAQVSWEVAGSSSKGTQVEHFTVSAKKYVQIKTACKNLVSLS